MGLKVVLWKSQEKLKGEPGSHTIKLYVKSGGSKHAYVGLKLYVKKDDFNKRSGRVKDTHANAALINSKISAAYNRMENLLHSNPNLSTKEIIAEYKKSPDAQTGDSVIKFFAQFIKDCENGVRLYKARKRSNATIKSYKTTYNQLKLFRPDLTFNQINNAFYNEYTSYLQNERKEDGVTMPGLDINSVGNRIKNLKLVLREANEAGKYHGFEHTKKYFAVPKEETDSIYLTEDEIQKIIDLDLSKHPHLQQERDRFLISYFFLFRYSDSIRVDKAMLFENGGRKFFRMRSQKTSVPVILPIKPIALEILERNNYSFQSTTNQQSNEKLKEIGEMAGIENEVLVKNKRGPKWNWITTHTARRSGATHLYLARVDEKMIMMLGGWKKAETLRSYIRVKEEENAMIAADLPFFK